MDTYQDLSKYQTIMNFMSAYNGPLFRIWQRGVNLIFYIQERPGVDLYINFIHDKGGRFKVVSRDVHVKLDGVPDDLRAGDWIYYNDVKSLAQDLYWVYSRKQDIFRKELGYETD